MNLTYQKLMDSHAESLLPMWSDENVIQFTNIQSPCTLKEVHERINILKGFDVFVVYQKKTVIGLIGCPCIDHEKAHFGLFYHFQKSAWGKGNATLATEWLLKFMGQRYLNATLFADVVVDNIASEKIIKKFGFKLISEEHFERNGVKMKLHNYRT